MYHKQLKKKNIILYLFWKTLCVVHVFLLFAIIDESVTIRS